MTVSTSSTRELLGYTTATCSSRELDTMVRRLEVVEVVGGGVEEGKEKLEGLVIRMICVGLTGPGARWGARGWLGRGRGRWTTCATCWG